jgi:hypothetical protein
MTILHLNSIWHIIFEIIESLPIMVDIYKVVVHSNNTCNNYVNIIVSIGYDDFSLIPT